MSTVPWPPNHLLTVEEFTALPEDNSRRYELEEGVLIVSPRPVEQHQRTIYRLVPALNEQLPLEWEAHGEVEMIVDDDGIGTVRVPDVIVTQADCARAQVPASDVLLAVEVISPGSRKKDTLVKPIEYAEAGIPHYWVIDLESPVSLIAYRLGGTLGYQEAPAVTGEFVTTEPFPLRVDLTALTAPRSAGVDKRNA
jgi:Uma2 family endonuclease